MKYEVMLKLSIEAESERDAFEKFICSIATGDFRFDNLDIQEGR